MNRAAPHACIRLLFACIVALAIRVPVRADAPFLARDLAVPMRDGVVLRADLRRPAGEGRFPTLVYRTPYGKTATSDGALVRKAVERGYAVLVQDVRGRYTSDGVFAPYTQEGRDGYDTIEWAAAQPWSNARVGTFGLSYPAAVQWLAAIESPPHLEAMVPAMSFATPAHFWYAGGVWDGSWLAWTWHNIAPDLRRRLGVAGPRTEAEAEAAWSREGAAMQALRPLEAMPAFRGVAPWYYEWLRHGPWDPWWDWAELDGKYPRVKAAVLNLSGWHDEMYGPAGAAMNFSSLVQSRGGDPRTARTRLLIGPWMHGTDLATTRIGTREMGAAAALDYDALVLDWMDRWLRDLDNGVDREPTVQFYAMGAGAWRAGDDWPPRAERRALFLAGGAVAGERAGQLDWSEPGPAGAASFVSDAARPVRDPHEGAAGGRDFRALSKDPGVLVFETAPLAADLEVVGPIEAEIHLSVDRPDTDLWVRLLDVAPDGTAWNLMSTGSELLRASHRNRRPVRELLEPGTVYRLRLDTLMTANRFLRGHRIRVALMASFAPNMSWNLHTGESESHSARTDRAHITVHTGGAQASRLVLPVAEDTALPPEPNPHAAEAIGTVRQMYDGALTPELAVTTFRNIDRLFPTRRVARSAAPLPLPRAELDLGAVRFRDRGRERTLEEFVERERVAGLLVLQDGRIRLERYRFGNTPRTRWMSMSIAKSISATLVGAALHQGRIGALADPVARYVPALAGSAYGAASVRDVLMMASGIGWNETYTDPRSDRRRLLEAQIAQRPGAVLELLAALPRVAPPGRVNLYSTGETQVVGELLRGAIGMPLADYLHERIWDRVGMEADASWWLDASGGREIAGSGFSATLRDYGRFGLFLLADGRAGGEAILPPGWVREAGSPQPLADGRRPDYGYLWWTGTTADSRRDGAFEALGIFGQHLYVNPAARVVIVVWGARVLPVDPAGIDPWPLFDAVTARLRAGG